MSLYSASHLLPPPNNSPLLAHTDVCSPTSEQMVQLSSPYLKTLWWILAMRRNFRVLLMVSSPRGGESRQTYFCVFSRRPPSRPCRSFLLSSFFALLCFDGFLFCASFHGINHCNGNVVYSVGNVDPPSIPASLAALTPPTHSITFWL